MNKHKLHEIDHTEKSLETSIFRNKFRQTKKRLEAIGVVNSMVHFPTVNSASERRTFDFGPSYGKGIDDIVRECQTQIERFLTTGDGDLSPNTVVGYCKCLRSFFSFCSLTAASLNRELTLSDINRDLIEGYLTHLSEGSGQLNGKKYIYSAVKSVLVALGSRSRLIVTERTESIFPRNPHPHSNRSNKGQKPLSTHERKALAAALKTAVMPLFLENARPTTDLLSYALLIIALRTGRNATPLITMGVDCLRPHPKSEMQLLVVYKRRGNTTHKVPVRDVKELETMASVLPDVVRLIERVKEITAPLRSQLPGHLQNRLWVCYTRSFRIKHFSYLNESSIRNAVKLLVKSSDLRDANGHPLRVNISRLRKTFANRIFEILDGDVLTTSRALGNTPKVTDRNYLVPSENSKKDWRFMGETLVNELKSGKLIAESTPTGHCTDNKNGQFAPKNGANCTDFLSCLRCRNYVVTGDDLHRVFSFYWLVIRERDRLGNHIWSKRYAHIVRLIDRDIATAGVKAKKFTQARVDAARELARTAPHPYWSTHDILGFS